MKLDNITELSETELREKLKTFVRAQKRQIIAIWCLLGIAFVALFVDLFDPRLPLYAKACELFLLIYGGHASLNILAALWSNLGNFTGKFLNMAQALKTEQETHNGK